MPTPWRHVAGSVVGTSHLDSGLPCQDANGITVLFPGTDHEIVIAVVADGAGSAEKADEGSAFVCRSFLDNTTSLLTAAPDEPLTDDFMWQVFLAESNRIVDHAKTNGRSERDYATTFLAVIATANRTACIQLGDGAIVVQPVNAAALECVFWPQCGEYVNSTNFITDQTATKNVAIRIIETGITHVGMFTDGLQMLALNYALQTVHAPFFQPMFARLAAEQPGQSTILTMELKKFLASPRVQERTDDDKTLLLAIRDP